MLKALSFVKGNTNGSATYLQGYLMFLKRESTIVLIVSADDDAVSIICRLHEVFLYILFFYTVCTYSGDVTAELAWYG